MNSTNIPEVKLGIVAVSRDCFPIALSEKRRAAITAACASPDATALNSPSKVGHSTMDISSPRAE